MSTEQINYFVSILPSIDSFATFASIVIMPFLIILSFLLSLFMPQIFLNLQEQKSSAFCLYLRILFIFLMIVFLVIEFWLIAFQLIVPPETNEEAMRECVLFLYDFLK